MTRCAAAAAAMLLHFPRADRAFSVLSISPAVYREGERAGLYAAGDGCASERFCVIDFYLHPRARSRHPVYFLVMDVLDARVRSAGHLHIYIYIYIYTY